MISAPEGLTTTYTRDVFGKPTTLTRSGSFTPAGAPAESLSLQRRYVYDVHQRLCKTIEPDAGITVWDYGAAGNVAWRATAQNALTAPQDCQHGAVGTANRSVHHYDTLNRLLFIDHPTNTDDVGYTYEPDGALASATVGVLNAQATDWTTTRNRWTYTYNRRRLLESETLQVLPENKSFAIDWSYNTRGDLASLIYPSGLNLDFNPNAYGEPRQAGTFATAGSYHPSGRLVGFSYGNGVTRATTVNSRQLPQRIHDQHLVRIPRHAGHQFHVKPVGVWRARRGARKTDVERQRIALERLQRGLRGTGVLAVRSRGGGDRGLPAQAIAQALGSRLSGQDSRTSADSSPHQPAREADLSLTDPTGWTALLPARAVNSSPAGDRRANPLIPLRIQGRHQTRGGT